MAPRELWQEINNRLAQADWGWRNNEMWDSFKLQRAISPMHQALSGIFAVTGEAPPVAASATVDTADGSYEKTSFDATIWTADLVVRARRGGGDEVVIVSVLPRSSLTEFEVLRAPIVTTSGFESRDERVELRLTYPDQVVMLEEHRSPGLLGLIPSFIRDLSA